MAGLFFDENVQGRPAEYLQQVLDRVGLSGELAAVGVRFLDYPDSGFPGGAPDRDIWNYCQASGLILFTDNRNNDGPDSLQATLDDSLTETSLPVLTVGDKGEYENSPRYAERVARSVAEVLFGVATSATEYRGVGRLFVPLPQYP